MKLKTKDLEDLWNALKNIKNIYYVVYVCHTKDLETISDFIDNKYGGSKDYIINHPRANLGDYAHYFTMEDTILIEFPKWWETASPDVVIMINQFLENKADETET